MKQQSMNVIGTAALLMVTLIAVPLLTWWLGAPLGTNEAAALRTLLGIFLVAWLASFVAGELTGNVSQVDRLWSILPVVYAWVMAGYGDFTPRLLVMASLVSVWGARLTWNFSRQGGYRRGYEDHRWRMLRARPEFRPRWRWTLFNLLFISGYQNLLLLLLTLPMLVALQFDATPWWALDWTAAVLMLALILLEAVADNQQWRFQAAKRALVECSQPLTGSLAKGFLESGLWAHSRHPNYVAEQGLWLAFYLFSVAASGQWLNWSLGGAILLVALFQGSTAFSEEISAGKYPEYGRYQERVPRFIPVRWVRK